MKKILIASKEESYLIDLRKKKDINVKEGIIKYNLLRRCKIGQKIKTHLGYEFTILEPLIIDIIEKDLERGPQVILPKDLGIILAYTSLKPKSLIIDAGTGSGFFAIQIANFFPLGKIVSYEKDERFYNIAKRNLERCGLKNVVLKKRDVEKGFEEKNADLINLDLKNVDKVVKKAFKSLKAGGWISIYSPTIQHLIKTRRILKKLGFYKVETFESILREWQYEKTLRPKTLGIVHTGFITLGRKL